jgi:hypothetical protein
VHVSATFCVEPGRVLGTFRAVTTQIIKVQHLVLRSEVAQRMHTDSIKL